MRVQMEKLIREKKTFFFSEKEDEAKIPGHRVTFELKGELKTFPSSSLALLRN